MINEYDNLMQSRSSLSKHFSIRKKTKIDILVDDGLNVVSRTSYVFPTHLIESTPLPPIEPNEQFALNSGSYF